MNSICRICESTEIFVNLIENTNKILLKMLKTFAEIQFNPNDFLPKCICKKCLINLEFAYNFKKQCEYTDQRLRKLLQASEGTEIQNIVYLVKSEDLLNFDVNFRNVANYEELEDEANQDQENIIQDDSERIDLLKENEINFVECCSFDSEIKKETEVEETPSNTNKKYIGIDIDKKQMIEIDKIIEVVNEIPEVQINNSTDPIQIVNEFKRQTIKNQNFVQPTICKQSQITVEHSPTKRNDETVQRLKNKRKIKTNKKIIRVSKKKHYTCNVCDEVFYGYDKLNEHKKSHGKQQHQCPECGKWFSKVFKMKYHLITHKNEKNFHCNLCARRYTNQGNLDRHIRVFHNQERKHVCKFCDKRFHQSDGLKQHLLTHTDDKPFVCDICDKLFKSNFRLNSHKKRHSPSFREQQRLKPYNNLKPNKKTFICQFCGRISSTLYIHQNHLRTHTGEKPYECFVCKKRFSFVLSLQSHVRIHTNERPYKCDQCHLTFRQDGHLRSHKLAHSGVKSHKCLICSKSFGWRGNLTVHMRLHTGETPYHCTQCPMQFSDSKALRRHKLIHTNNCA